MESAVKKIEKQPEDSSVKGFHEKISKHLECFICFHVLEEASACPKCSKYACLKCFQNWFKSGNSNCPFCRQPLNSKEIVKLPVLDDIRKWSEKIDSETNESNDKINTVVNEGYCLDEDLKITKYNSCFRRCEIHNKKLTIKCTTCNQLICSHCGLLSQTHKEHSLKSINEIYNEYQHELQAKIKNIESNIQHVNKKVDFINETTIKVNDKYESMLFHVDKCFKLVTNFIRANNKFDIVYLSRLEEKCTMKLNLAQNELEETKTEMKCMNVAEFVDQFDQMSDRMDALMQTLLSCDEYIVDPIKPIPYPTESSYLEFMNFSQLFKGDETIFSDSVHHYSTTWKLSLGTESGCTNSLILTVHLLSCLFTDIEYQYSVSLDREGLLPDHLIESHTITSANKLKSVHTFDLSRFAAYVEEEKNSLLIEFEVRPNYDSGNSCSDGPNDICKQLSLAVDHKNSMLILYEPNS